VGGEVRVLGNNPDGVPWKIGIQSPDAYFLDISLHGIAQLTAGSVATSGSYRNYTEKNGKRYAHILDPRTGQAILSNLLSVSVLSDSCIDADGWATALYVLGVDEGLTYVEENPMIEALFITSTEDGQLQAKYSSGFLEKTDYQSIKMPRQQL
jgi:thiamine biosynthesis lipoprotein